MLFDTKLITKDNFADVKSLFNIIVQQQNYQMKIDSRQQNVQVKVTTTTTNIGINLSLVCWNWFTC